MKLSQVPWSIPDESLMWNAKSAPIPWYSHCECGCLIKWPKEPCRLGLIFKTVGLNGRQEWMSSPPLTGFCMDAASFLVSHQPTLFIIASTFALYGTNPLCFLVSALSVYNNLSALSDLSNKCLHVSLIHIFLSHLCFPLFPHLCLSFSLPISLARWIVIARSIYYEQINVAYAVGDRLSPWQHMRENFRVFQAD